MKELGLNTQEERVYRALLSLGMTTTGPLCKEANITSSHIYQVLDRLTAKGLVSCQEKNKRKLFFVAPPEVAKTMFDRRLEEVEEEKNRILLQKEEHLNILKKIKPLINSGTYFKYFENISGIKAMYKELEEQMKVNPTSELLIFSHKPEDVKKVSAFYDEVHTTRESLNIAYKAIFDTSLKQIAKTRKNSKIKFMVLKNSTAWGTYDNIFFIYHLSSKKPYGILIKDPLIANTFVLTFETIFETLN